MNYSVDLTGTTALTSFGLTDELQRWLGSVHQRYWAIKNGAYDVIYCPLSGRFLYLPEYNVRVRLCSWGTCMRSSNGRSFCPDCAATNASLSCDQNGCSEEIKYGPVGCKAYRCAEHALPWDLYKQQCTYGNCSAMAAYGPVLDPTTTVVPEFEPNSATIPYRVEPDSLQLTSSGLPIHCLRHKREGDRDLRLLGVAELNRLSSKDELSTTRS